ncbi:cyclin-domain-containing protein [Cokeromyces recurvatus]|uniref:cyclin-domain-containing protein n=1 Tax=Cokeromyces recurvatus TaxID=90255 RepID=UPI00221F8E88|nr:cyclin-domain-containing protein [Cokeromyces recurvatus]KAI7902627.1 cyclin-domain-containing protein [Cokeromyces recurvatus]
MLSITFDLAKYPTIDTIKLLASLLERMTIANDILNKQQCRSLQPIYTRFHARLVPSIDIHSYLSRILKYCPCANECFLSLLVYFDRMSKNSLAITGKPFMIDSFNIHRLIIAGVMVASKFFSDVFYTNTRYAKVGGLSVAELNNLELEFLKLNSYNLTVPVSELQKYGDQLLKVGYMTQKMRKPASFRHQRSSSFDQARIDVDKICDSTQRMSLDQPYQQQYYYQQQKSNDHQQQVRRMTSTNSLKEYQQYYGQPKHSRSSINLHQGYWKPNYNSSIQKQSRQHTEDKEDYGLSSSIYAPPFIPSNSSNNMYYYSASLGGIPTPPPSSSPIYYQASTLPSSTYMNL